MLAFIGVLINKMECCKCAWRVRQRGSRNVDNVGGDDGHGNIHAGADLAGGGTDDSVTSSASLYENDKVRSREEQSD